MLSVTYRVWEVSAVSLLTSGRRPQFFATWTSPRACFTVLGTWRRLPVPQRVQGEREEEAAVTFRTERHVHHTAFVGSKSPDPAPSRDRNEAFPLEGSSVKHCVPIV